MHRRLAAIWYGDHLLGLLMAPLSWLFCLAVILRRLAYQRSLVTVRRFAVPVIVVGNITVGGTGKTPLVIWLARCLMKRGYRPAIVCRGCGGRARHWPQSVRPGSDPLVVGDEAVLMAQRAGCPVAAGPDRVAAAKTLLADTGCDLILSDDGMQHFALGRDVEIAVIDGIRRHGNGRCLPAGPLREPASRLRKVDIVVTNGLAGPGEFEMTLIPRDPRWVRDERKSRSLGSFKGNPVHAVCGIGHPDRFFNGLTQEGLDVLRHPYADHHVFAPEDIEFGDGLPVLMTEKDAVKCRGFAGSQHWYLPVEAALHPEFGDRVLALLKRKWDGQKVA